jgi:LemA protein
LTTTQISIWVGAAVLLFWTVGAYNRLVRLRNTIARRFGPVDDQFRQRQTLLLQLCDALVPLLGDEPQHGDALRAACQQAEGAHVRARAHPGVAAVANSLRMAEEILADTRSRLPAVLMTDPALGELGSALAASDATLAFARRQFNDAAAEYNHAVRQFPTWLIASLFRFSPAGTL